MTPALIAAPFRQLIEKLERVANLVANLAHPKGDHRENLLEDEAHDLLREIRADLLAGAVIPQPEEKKLFRETTDFNSRLDDGLRVNRAEETPELEEARSRSPQLSAWLPIASAPRGERVLVTLKPRPHEEHGEVVFAYWTTATDTPDDEGGVWTYDDTGEVIEPLPELWFNLPPSSERPRAGQADGTSEPSGQDPNVGISPPDAGWKGTT